MSRLLPLQASARRVRRLRLRSTDADTVRHASTTLSDALHTASLPDADGGRLLVIRRLNLGRISANASSATLALLLERTTRAAADQAVHFDQPGAELADAISFPGRTEAVLGLARRVARRQSLRGWFWDQLLPGWSTAKTRPAQW
ncbi:MAG: hypothetical protein ACREH8_04615, partial [Opitutaceae bacterium]